MAAEARAGAATSRARRRSRCGGAAVLGALLLWATNAGPQVCFTAAGPQGPRQQRRAVAAGLLASMLVGLDGQSAHGLVDVIDYREAQKQRREAGKKEKGKQFTPEEIAEIMKRRETQKYAEERVLAEFRAVFSEFAAEDTPLETREEMVQKMIDIVRRDGILPEGIKEKDIKRGVTVTFANIGCVKGKCPKLQKNYEKLLAVIGEVNDTTS